MCSVAFPAQLSAAEKRDLVVAYLAAAGEWVTPGDGDAPPVVEPSAWDPERGADVEFMEDVDARQVLPRGAYASAIGMGMGF